MAAVGVGMSLVSLRVQEFQEDLLWARGRMHRLREVRHAPYRGDPRNFSLFVLLASENDFTFVCCWHSIFFLIFLCSVAKEEHDLEPAARDDDYISPRIYMCEEPCATTPHHICDMEDHNISLTSPLLGTKAAGRDGSSVLILVGWFGHGLSNWWLLINLSKREHLGYDWLH
jgi:hypothetical protein